MPVNPFADFEAQRAGITISGAGRADGTLEPVGAHIRAAAGRAHDLADRQTHAGARRARW
ncbi:hypothetical protein CNR27_12150 [Luteimonas chenhongjianii]|uniref:Uncharacterized protein n=2 Tax=Luteimonas chenhongjianii TaxID=2006110 RepID=A0A290XG34_9GAMM|nr:hypothetical protein CNR27_12150 [Luteimonas chenhongjianii]